jgi:alkyldihydroxyacetonephosphate synthase
MEHDLTPTHHHAVGRDHKEWYAKQIPENYGEALQAVKGVLDPAGVMNPGVLVDRPTE